MSAQLAGAGGYSRPALAVVQKALHLRLCPRPDRCLYQGDHFAHAVEIVAALDQAGYAVTRADLCSRAGACSDG